MFVDEIKIKLIAGNGGDGCTSFHHEKCMPNLGPDGGNGGKGSSIIFVTDKSLKTLVDLRYHKIIKGHKGVNGKGDDRTGANALDIIIKVPLGTTITNLKNNKVIADLVNEDDKVIVAHGGRGGRGNKAFKTHDHPNPEFSEKGAPGEELEVKCELKLLADAALIGFPSVGKSTILSLISASKPKIAAYHFTTLSPNLGVVYLKDHRSFVLADLPGLIEGASKGLGLGEQFLRHATRAKVLVQVVDMGAEEGRNPIEDYEIINNELKAYGHNLYKKQLVVIANKMDLPNAGANLEKFKKKYKDVKVFPISAYLNEGLDEALKAIMDEIDNYQEEEVEEEVVNIKYEEEKPFTITKENDCYIVKGSKIERLFLMTKFNEEESILRFGSILKKMGVDDELKRMGAHEGDTIVIEDYLFQFKE